MIGLKSVKKQIDRIIATDIVETERKKRRDNAYESGTMHMIFGGNPGTAKTTVAKLFAGIAKEKGIIKSGAFVERGGMDLDGMGCVMDRFGLNDYQVRKLSQIRFEMLTEKEYQSYKEKIERMEASREDASALYHEQKVWEIELEIKRLEVYFAAVEHYEEIIKWIVEIEDT